MAAKDATAKGDAHDVSSSTTDTSNPDGPLRFSVKPVDKACWRPREEWPHFPKIKTTNGLVSIPQCVKDNFAVSMTVALISMPLSSALAIASGSTPMMGIATSFWSGLWMGIFGSSDFNIVGCSGALSPMVSQYITTWGANTVPYLSLISSGILIVFRVFRLDKYLFHMPPAVFEGFSIAVAVIIGLNQLQFAFGVTPLVKHGHFYMNVGESLRCVFAGSLEHCQEVEQGSTAIHVPNFLYFFFNTCLLLVLMGKVKKIGKFAVGNYWIPVSAIIGCLIGWGLSADGPTPAYLADGSTPALPTLRDTYGEDAFSPQLIFPLHAPNSVFRADCVADGESSGGHRRLSVYDDCVPGTDIVQFIVAAAKIAFVCALETILSAKVASVRRKDYPFDEPRELAAVSISHFVQFITGTLPNTGLFLRTTANAVGGATHRWSQLMHVLLLGILTGALSRFFGYLPKAGAAAILVTGSFRMVPYNYLARLWRNDKMRLALTVLVTAVSCFEDPVVGLLLGIGLSLVSEATRMVQGGNAVVITQLAKQQRTGFKVTINGSLNYIVGEQVEKAMKVLKGTAEFVVVDMASVFEADSDGAMYLEKGKTGLEAAEPSCPIFLMNMLPQVAEVLRGTSSDLRELEKKVPAKGLQIDMSPWEEKAGSAWGQSVPIVDGPRHRSAGGDAADNRESLSL